MTHPARGADSETSDLRPQELAADYELRGELGRGVVAAALGERKRALRMDVAVNAGAFYTLVFQPRPVFLSTLCVSMSPIPVLILPE